MAELLFKTNIKCNGCIAKVTPLLNDEKDIEKWNVDLASQDRILSVTTEKTEPAKVIELLGKAGYTAEAIASKA